MRQGEANALTSKELVRLTGFRSVRELQAEIAHERDTGVPILSTCRSPGGYFLPADGEDGKRELSTFIRTVHARAANTYRATESAKKALQRLNTEIMLDNIERL